MLRILACVGLLLLAGCSQPPPAPDQASGLGEADGEDSAAEGDSMTTSDQTVSQGPPPSRPASGGPAASQGWFLHIERTCDESDPFCNCGSTRTFMDREDRVDECDGHGNRPSGASGADPQFHLAESWPADEVGASWPEGTPLEGVLYVTTDVQSTYDYFLVLLVGDEVVAQTTPRQGTATEAGFGLHYTPMPFDGELEQEVPEGADLRLELHLRWVVATSYFIGYDDDHVSRFTLGAMD